MKTITITSLYLPQGQLIRSEIDIYLSLIFMEDRINNLLILEKDISIVIYFNYFKFLFLIGMIHSFVPAF